VTDAERDGLDLAPLRAALAPFGALVAARRIREGDEAAFAGAAGHVARRRASGAARIAARRLLGELGSDRVAGLLRPPAGGPAWPAGIIGSLAHDEEYALAAVARRGALAGIGVDVEPAEPLPADLTDLVLNPAERAETGGDRVAERMVFVAKEAVYKAIHPIDGSPLEYEDIAVSFTDGTAALMDGRRLKLLTLRGERLAAVALAFGG
jgi:4'-phosphopantetheinyl transferase EntD